MGKWLAPALAALVLWALFLPAVDPAANRLILDLRPPAALLLLLAGLALLALWRRRLASFWRWVLGVVLCAAAGLQLAAMLVLSLLDRQLDLYFDLPQVPSLVGLFRDAVGPFRAAGALVLVVLGVVALLAAVAWAIAVCERAVQRRHAAVTVLVLAVAAFGLGAVARDAKHETLVAFAAPAAIADQAARLYRAALVMSGRDHRYDAMLHGPVLHGDLGALAGRDVFVVFVESYGTLVLDEPRYRDVVAPALAAFAAATQRAGYGMRSSRLVSPVFGAGSWLAHGTLASGMKLDPFLDRLIVESDRKTLAQYLRSSGHDTVAVMPGIKKPWPEAAFWGFERSYFAKDLGYDGPGFGWFDIPDQYTLAHFAAGELGPGHKPLFAEIVLVSSHTPFAPVPPYVADWNDAGPYKSVAEAEWRRIYRPPDWAHLDAPYLDSVVYDIETLAGWLARLDGNGLVVILGDHQPPGFASGTTAPWTVPVQVLSRDPALLAPFARAGYGEGALPPPSPQVKGMESFLGEFLANFSTAGS